MTKKVKLTSDYDYLTNFFMSEQAIEQTSDKKMSTSFPILENFSIIQSQMLHICFNTPFHFKSFV